MRRYFDLVTFSHTIFALPFALVGYTLAVHRPDFEIVWLDLLLVVGCMVFARSAAMAFNRLADAGIDSQNARTQGRDIPAGRVSRREASLFTVFNSIAFVICAGLLNPLCLALSPLALAIVLGYSYTKRFTWLCHLILGLGLSLAPIGAYLAVTGAFAPAPVLLGLVVLLWVAGFDMVYALQDEQFDKEQGLFSVPVRFGESRTLLLARISHFFSAALLVYVTLELGKTLSNTVSIALTWLAALCFIILLVRQHLIVGEGRLERINQAFFTTNGLASVVYAFFLISGIIWQAWQNI